MKDEKLETGEADGNITIKTESLLGKRRVRPEVEGITVPFAEKPASARPNLTAEEKKLIEEAENQRPAKVLPKSPKITLPPRKSRGKKAFLVFLSLIVLALASYGVYSQYLVKTVFKPAPENSSMDSAEEQNVFTSTSQPSSLPAPENASATATSPVFAPTATPQSMAASSTLPAAAPAAQLKIAATPTGFLNVRQQPSLGSAILTKVHPGETYDYTDHKNGFYLITLPGGKSGWVAEQYTTR